MQSLLTIFVTKSIHASRSSMSKPPVGVSNALFIYLPELFAMRDFSEPYYIYRVYEIGEGGAKFRASKEMWGFADSVLKAISTAVGYN